MKVRGLFNAKAILLEEQVIQFNPKEDKRVNTFTKSPESELNSVTGV